MTVTLTDGRTITQEDVAYDTAVAAAQAIEAGQWVSIHLEPIPRVRKGAKPKPVAFQAINPACVMDVLIRP